MTIPLTSTSTASDHIEFLLQNLNASNVDSVSRELCEYTAYGVDESILIIRVCLDHLNINDNKGRDAELESVFASVFKNLLNKSNFSTIFCGSLMSTSLSEGFLKKLSDIMHLSASERIGLGLVLSDSENIDLQTCGKNFCMSQIMELCAQQMSGNSADPIQQILLFLNRSEGLSKHLDAFMQMLSPIQLDDEVQFILSAFFSDELHEANFFRKQNFLKEDEDDFDSLLADMGKEMSIADVMKEIGYSCTANVSQCKKMLSLFSPVTEVTVARVLGTISRTHAVLEDNQNVFSAFRAAIAGSSLPDTPLSNSWNSEVLVDSIKQLAPGISWAIVFEKLDHDGFYIPSEESFSFLISIYKHVCKDPFPLHVICGSVWKNVEGQISFLKYAVSVPPEVFTFTHSERQLNMEALNGPKLKLTKGNHVWLCLDLLEVLCLVAERGHANSVRSILEYPLKHCPEVLLLGMTHVNTAYNLIQKEVSSVVFTGILNDVPGSGLLLHLWHVNPSMLLWGFVDALNVNQNYIFRILDVCWELKILSQVLDMLPSFWGIKLAAVSSAKELLDLEKWLITNLTAYKDAFYGECLGFLKEVLAGAQEVSVNQFQPFGGLYNILSETSSTFLKVLQSHAGILSSHNLYQEMEKLYVGYMDIGRSDGAGSSATDGYAADIEAEANSYFHQMFSGQLKNDGIVQMLTQLKVSPETRENSIFECMIANLFEEYKFFSKYPEMQRNIAGVLFGSLIRHQLVTHTSLGVALRAVLDALHRPADSKMFVFGTKALEQFLDRLIEWPQYCNYILQISHLRDTYSDLVAFVEWAFGHISSVHLKPEPLHSGSVDRQSPNQTPLKNLEMPVSSFHFTGSGGSHPGLQVPSSLQTSKTQQYSLDEGEVSPSLSNYSKPTTSSAGQSAVTTSSDTSGVHQLQPQKEVYTSVDVRSSGIFLSSGAIPNARFGSILNIKTLIAAAERRETPIESPESEFQDKISFVINNLPTEYIEAKANELADILKEQYFPWFAQYMVMKRVSIEPDFHELYLKFLDKVNSKLLNKEVLRATNENCKVLLGSELIKSSSEERSLLKNLGSWLGKITIGRNQVLRAREIDPKSLIIEAYERGLMIAVIPFTSKILESCQSSIAYQPPNPWTMAVLGLLAEINSLPNLRMNLKFEIEVLFKKLGVDMRDVSPTSLVKHRVREVDGNPDFSIKDVESSQQLGGEVKSCMILNTKQFEVPPEVAGPVLYDGHSRVLPQIQYAAPLHMASVPLSDEKLSAVRLSDQLPPAQMVLYSLSPFVVNQLPSPMSIIEQQVVVNPRLHALGLHLPFRRALKIAMDRATKEIVLNILHRPVSVATQTTKELVLKDYAMEADENQIRNAARLMVASLAGRLAHVTCKEPLSNSISSQLRNALQGLNIAIELLEQAVLLLTNDNLNIGCAVIEQAAMEKATHVIDGEMAQMLALRRTHREGVGRTFFDTNLYAQGSFRVLPEALRPKPCRLSLSQQRVYEDFLWLSRQNQSIQNPTAVEPVVPSTSSVGGTSRVYVPISGKIDPGICSSGFISPTVSVSKPLNIVPEEINTTAAQILRNVSSAPMGLGEGASPQNLDSGNIVQSYSSVFTDLLSAEHTVVVQESGVAVQIHSRSSASDRSDAFAPKPLLTTGDALDKYQIVSDKLETLLANGAKETVIQGVIAEVPAIILRCISRDEAALAVAQKAFKDLYGNALSNVHVNAHLSVLSAIRDVSKLVVKEITSWVIYSNMDQKFHIDITVGLIRSELLNLAEYNIHMAELLDGGRNKIAKDFAISLVQTFVNQDSRVISELQKIVDALAKLTSRPDSFESSQQLVEIAKNPTAASTSCNVSIANDDSTGQCRDNKGVGFWTASREDAGGESAEPDTVVFHDQVSSLFVEWCQICDHPVASDIASAFYVSKLQKTGLLNGDETTDRFFCQLTEISISRYLSAEMVSASPSQSQIQPPPFRVIDVYAKLVCCILKFCPVDQGSSKFFLLSKVLAVTVKFIQKDAEERKISFNPRPYFRLFINWILDLCSLDPVSDGANFQVLTSLANALHALQPLRVPGFSFAWLEIASHRSFMPKLLTGNAQKQWPYFQRLLLHLFQFMEPSLRNTGLGESMRNIILSTFPRKMRLPDSSSLNLKIGLLAEINQSPCILSDVDATLQAEQMKTAVDAYLKTRQQGSTFLVELKQKLLLSPNEAAQAGTPYNVPLINSLVLYVGMQAIEQLQTRTPPNSQSMIGDAPQGVTSVDAAMDIFQTLITDLDAEGRYLFLNAVANQLRYPNNHTQYFSFILLYLFAESNQEVVQEQITRVLLERINVFPPHPWGLLVTFSELIMDSRFKFWSRSFVRCAPEIEKLLESFSRCRRGLRVSY